MKVPINSISEWEKNKKLRKINPKRYDELKTSLAKLGQIQSILIDGRDNKTVLGGNHQLRAMKELFASGDKRFAEVEVIIQTPRDDAEGMEMGLKHNSHFAEYEIDLLRAEVGRLGLKFDDIHIGAGELDLRPEEEENKEDNYKEPEDLEEKVKEGQLWKLGEHRLLCGDSTKHEDIDWLLDGAVVDMVFTDPPYNVDYEGSDGQKIQNDKFDSNESFYLFLRDAFSLICANMGGGCPIYVSHADGSGNVFRRAFVDAGFDLKQVIIWVKNSMVLGRQDYQCQHEPILYGWKPGDAHRWYGRHNKKTIIDEEPDCNAMSKAELLEYVSDLRNERLSTIVRIAKPKVNDDHPTMKPLKLVGYFLRNSSQPGDIILDSFGGSGSTLIACEQLGRKCYTMELDPHYASVIVDRWEKLTGNKAELVS